MIVTGMSKKEATGSSSSSEESFESDYSIEDDQWNFNRRQDCREGFCKKEHKHHHSRKQNYIGSMATID